MPGNILWQKLLYGKRVNADPTQAEEIPLDRLSTDLSGTGRKGRLQGVMAVLRGCSIPRTEDTDCNAATQRESGVAAPDR